MLGPLVLLAWVAIIYGVLAAQQRQDPRGWSRWRIASFMTGCALLAWALVPALLPYALHDFRQHMLQHLLIGMIAPLALVMAAPMTLVLRALPTRYGRWIGRLLRTPFVHGLAHPVTALILNLGGMAALYFTPLYAVMMAHPWVHHLVHVHFLAAGYLFCWVIAGPDPAPRRPSVPARLVILGVAIAVHASLSQMLYAGLFVTIEAPMRELRGGAELMYYGGDIAELLLAFALVSRWHPQPRSARPDPERAPEPSVAVAG